MKHINIQLTVIGITIPPGAAPGTTLQFPIPAGTGSIAQKQQTREEQNRDKLLKQQYYQNKQDRKQKEDVKLKLQQQTESKKKQYQYQKKQDDFEYNQQYQEYRRRDRQVAEMKVAKKEKQFELIGLSKRTAQVVPQGVGQVNRNRNPGAVYPSDGPGAPVQLEMKRGEKRSALLDGQFKLCCCYDTNNITELSHTSLFCTLLCCSTAGKCNQLLPCYSKQLFSIKEGEVGIIEDIGGKYVRTELPGPVLLSAPMCINMENLTMRLSTRVQQLVVRSETKTKDNGNIQ